MAVVFCDVNATGLNNGTTWENAYTSLQTAINNATPTTDQVWVKEGTFTLTGTISGVAGVDIYGGFNSVLTGTSGSIAGRNYWTDETILDGIDIYRIFNTGNHHIDGFIFTRGKSSQGGGIYAPGKTFTVSNCRFTDCSTTSLGGGAIKLSVSGVSPNGIFTNCLFSGNVTTGEGGAIHTRSGTASYTDCIFTGNSAGLDGGAVYSVSTISTFNNCEFNLNSSDVAGGAFFEEGVPTSSLKRCRFHTDTAGTYGGAVWSNGPSTIKECLFTGNEATTVAGGAVYKSRAPSNGQMDIINCTFFDNSAFSGGDAIDGDSTCVVQNCNVWNGSSGILAGVNVTYSNVQGGFTGTGNKNADPLFIGTCYDPANPYNIGPGSPCIDCANAGAPAETTDILGNARYDDPATPNTGVGSPPYVDMGCYEYQGCLPDAYVDLGVEF
jgi:predicted outer membrane repeat protein